MKKSDLVVMQEMASNNMDIRCSTSITGAKRIKEGVEISFGIDESTGQMLMSEMASGIVEHYCIMYIVNKKQFDTLKTAPSGDEVMK